MANSLSRRASALLATKPDYTKKCGASHFDFWILRGIHHLVPPRAKRRPVGPGGTKSKTEIVDFATWKTPSSDP
jgi:hypothetical protein